jgi:cytochrome c553
MMRRLLLVALIAFCSIATVRAADAPEARTFSQADLAFFESRIRPLLIEKCGECHGPKEQESKLRLDTWAGIAAGGKTGPLVVPGKPENSLLIVAVRYIDNDLRMPPDGKLSKQEIADLSRWIQMGLPHPDRATSETTPQPRRGEPIDFEQARTFWSFRPVKKRQPPVVEHADQVQTDIDRFILARLEAGGLTLSARADRRTLLRRITLDLIGLPPTATETDTFLADESPDAFAKVIDRLLNSPHYGERWGRHWLDVARYADSNGLDENIAHGNAWKYRDYVIASFNADKPYDRFLTEQIAGDLLPYDAKDVMQLDRRNERLIATGFLSLGPKVLAEVDAMKMEMDIIDEQLDTIGKSLLGLTFGCARCHDHKFDPVSQQDYYSLAGIFKSTRVMEHFKKVARWHENPVPSADDLERKTFHETTIQVQKIQINQIVAVAKQKLIDALPPGSKLEGDIEKQFPAETRAELKKERDKLAALEKETASLIPAAMGASEGTVTDLAIHLRGSHLTLGDPAPRRIPEVFAHLDMPRFTPDSSGRLELAQWLTSRDNPLTARVMVNRIWRWHFGQGLVASPDNFGLLGERPSHPQLLDWLAAEFMDSGWSIRHVHRLIVASSVYQQSSSRSTEVGSRDGDVDPENRLLSRFPLRRMEAEVLRDSLLAVSGMLDRSMGRSMLTVPNREWIFNHTSKDETKYDSPRRSIYLPVVRNNLYDVFQLFDYSDASVVNGSRDSSTVAPQALFMLNSELIQNAATQMAELLLADTELSDRERIAMLYTEVLGRPPTESETARLLPFVAIHPQPDKPSSVTSTSQAWAALCHVILASNEFIYVR